MANANAIVEKVARLGLRHGEKAGVAIATMVFLFCVGLAVSKPTIDTSPEKVKKAAQVADQNLSRNEDREAIIKSLETQGTIKPTDFAGAVDKQIQIKLVGSDFATKREWVTPEPGAGLIRDTPKLIAPSELYAYPGRGGLLVFALDSEGERIPVKEGEEDAKKPQKYGKVKKRRSGGTGGMGGGGMGGMMGGMRKKKKSKSKIEIAREEKEVRERKRRELKGLLAGGGAPKEAEKSEADNDEGGPFKQETKGYRWVAITGTLDHAQMLANFREALKNPNIAHPQYVRLDVQRRTLQPDGTWSSWEKIDDEKNYDILDNLPANEEELAPENVRPEGLVDPLPFLNAGLWEKVHIASLVPKEKVDVPEPPKNQMGPAGRGGMGGGSGGNMMQMMQMQNQMSKMGGGMMQNMMKNQQNMMKSMSTGSGMGMGMGLGMGMGSASESVGNFWKSEEKRVMIRALDFTAEPDQSYRYRVRIVVANPNFNRQDVNPIYQADTKKNYLEGPWSKDTDVVHMPPDIQPYVMQTLAENSAVKPKVVFQVVSFNRKDGWTVPHRFSAGVGDLVGELARDDVPSSDGSGVHSTPIDFSSRQIVLDLDAGGLQNLPAGLVGPSIQRPAYAALLRRDGAMIVRTQADDLANEFRRDIDANYKYEKEQSSKKREKSQGSGYAGMMQQMMGGMGGRMR